MKNIEKLFWMPLQEIQKLSMKLHKSCNPLSNLEFNWLRLKKDVNAEKQNVKKNIVNVLMLERNVVNFVNVKDVKIVEADFIRFFFILSILLIRKFNKNS